MKITSYLNSIKNIQRFLSLDIFKKRNKSVSSKSEAKRKKCEAKIMKHICQTEIASNVYGYFTFFTGRLRIPEFPHKIYLDIFYHSSYDYGKGKDFNTIAGHI